jgi:TP901 family phage tail tape measure protein
MDLKELRYRIYGDDKLSGKLDRISSAGKRVDKSLNKTSTRMSSLKNKVSGAASEIPGLTGGLRILTNPLTIAGAAIVGTGIALNRASIEAANFNSEFRELVNLNLDKSLGQINTLKQQILDISFKDGLDAFVISKGFYDIQSITGLYGRAVDNIVSKQAKFADVFNANPESFIGGTGKAMANFGFGSDKLDQFNRSSFATMKIGSLTFDQLSKIQAVYAGTASAAKQSFDSANKLFALFTTKRNNPAEAATLTKSAFEDLFKPEVMKTFNKEGILMFDKLTGKQKQVDKIMLELNSKFMALGNNDKAINKLRNQFKGSDGLRALIELSTKSTKELFATLNTFNSADTQFNKALKIANEDLNKINEKLENRTKTLMIEIGQAMLPVKNYFASIKNDVLIASRNVIELSFKTESNSFSRGRRAIQGQYGWYKENFNNLQDEDKNNLKARLENSMKVYSSRLGSEKDKFEINRLQALLQETALTHQDLFGAKNNTLPILAINNADNTLTNDSHGNMSKGLSGISGGGTQTKNVTVNINKLVESIINNTTNLNEALPEIEEKISEALVRAIAGAEQVI